MCLQTKLTPPFSFPPSNKVYFFIVADWCFSISELLQQQGRLRAATFQIVHHLLRSLLNAQCSAAALEGWNAHVAMARMCLCNTVYCVCVWAKGWMLGLWMRSTGKTSSARFRPPRPPTDPSLISLVPFDQSVVETIEKIVWKSTEPVLSFLLPGWFVSSLLIYSYSLFHYGFFGTM